MHYSLWCQKKISSSVPQPQQRRQNGCGQSTRSSTTSWPIRSHRLHRQRQLQRSRHRIAECHQSWLVMVAIRSTAMPSIRMLLMMGCGIWGNLMESKLDNKYCMVLNKVSLKCTTENLTAFEDSKVEFPLQYFFLLSGPCHYNKNIKLNWVKACYVRLT